MPTRVERFRCNLCATEHERLDQAQACEAKGRPPVVHPALYRFTQATASGSWIAYAWPTRQDSHGHSLRLELRLWAAWPPPLPGVSRSFVQVPHTCFLAPAPLLSDVHLHPLLVTDKTRVDLLSLLNGQAIEATTPIQTPNGPVPYTDWLRLPLSPGS